jgi:hypothetical protein
MQAAQEEMIRFERQEVEFRRRDRQQRAAELNMPATKNLVLNGLLHRSTTGSDLPIRVGQGCSQKCESLALPLAGATSPSRQEAANRQ